MYLLSDVPNSVPVDGSIPVPSAPLLILSKSSAGFIDNTNPMSIADFVSVD